MSLLQRVTSFESLAPERFSPERGQSPAGSRDRKLSFSPLPESWSPPAGDGDAQGIGAFEVSKTKRICGFLSLPVSASIRILVFWEMTMVGSGLTGFLNSTSIYSCNLLSFRGRNRLWICSY
jgi:hypothetical protein